MQDNVQEQLTSMGDDEKHLIALEQGGSCASAVLRVDCTADDVLDAYVHAYMALHAKQPLVGPLQVPDTTLGRPSASSTLCMHCNPQHGLAQRTLCTLRSFR